MIDLNNKENWDYSDFEELDQILKENDKIKLKIVKFKTSEDELVITKNNKPLMAISLHVNQDNFLGCLSDDLEHIQKMSKIHLKNLKSYIKYIKEEYEETIFLDEIIEETEIKLQKHDLVDYFFKNKNNIKLVLLEDDSCDMAQLIDEKNEKVLDTGNYHDFHNGCTSSILQDVLYSNLKEYLINLNEITKFLNIQKIQRKEATLNY